MADSDSDGVADTLVTAPGKGHAPEVHTFDSGFLALDSFFAYDPGFTGGVFVGG